ncbi:MAG: magnesium transporter CorA family protein, partial [Clostridia bacterium]|nr:magnesium transporter CorA family protein [Clostridia bacterium]
DVAIDTKQAIEMCSIYREILTGTMDAYGSVISNNLNIVMKVLTSVTLIISIPTLIASLFGMNTWVPGQGQKWGFWAVLGFSGIVSFILSIFLKKKKLL